MRHLVIDIETVAIDGVQEWVEAPTPPANYKDQTKIAAWILEKQQELLEKAALQPDLGRIVCIGAKSDLGEFVVPCETGTAERSALLWLMEMGFGRDGTRLVTFNGTSFDLPYIMRRCQLLQVEFPYVELSKYRPTLQHVDLMNVLTFNGTLTPRSLKWYAKRFGLSVTDATAGSDIAALVQEGDWDGVCRHCRSDVQLTYDLAVRLGVINAVSVVEGF